ncbi:flagellar motor protein MotB [Geothermobacter hydrogeniphilus]|uniref:Flagellar motor protein MotB n=1 Tax=Geothermobacter hydrogeniphilus TaxID=1969733 RepID=A0A1X0YE76_9BACT|nr:flagellar motor protein MotB [Geothermobacter hydrogeniphilus]ORJ63515.1 flagellar motor protein MotB [Geothermobacter hydrogeniphilus]PNU21126.1 flagellar motor protein MotB [Geothermobacter hydrogeniphilus]
MARKQKKAEAGAPAWMVTFSDMVTLLLTFFVLLLSMARLDKMKFMDAAGSLRGAFGVLGSSDKAEVTKPRIIDVAPVYDDLVSRVYKRVLAHLQRLRIDREIELVKDRGAVVLRVNSAILFDPGQTRVKPEAEVILQKISELVRPLPMSLRIEGHTDDIPSRHAAVSNWDISVQRAVNVLKFMAKRKLMPLERMSAVGYGSMQPVVPNDSPEHRAMNRRVEFVLENLGNYREDLPYLIDAQDQLPF